MNSDNQTRAFLLAHCQAYPRLELTDPVQGTVSKRMRL